VTIVASKNEMNQIMKQVQQMQADMMATQEKLAAETVEASVGGGAVKAVVTGSGTLESITIDPGAVDPDDVEMLQDLIVAAVNEGLRKAQELQAQGFGGITNALGGMPGLGNLFGQ
jgi:nucleoid-associated protein EbfC